MIEISDENIFENDILGRRQSIIDLSNLITSYSQPFVLSVNADWGSGKTTFLQLWKAYLKKEHEVNSIYFSAWEDDFSNEPLIAILGEVNNYIIENSCPSEVQSKFNTVKSIGSKIFKRALPAFIKGATMGAVDADEGFEAALGAISEESISTLIDNYNDEKKLLEKFKESMETLLKEINVDKPFIIFIDELDRCRPLYAIELLERLKHIFGVDNLIFVLAMDKNQLSESIKSQYGQIDANKYLKRFIDLEYNMKNPNVDVFCEALYRKYDFDSLSRKKGISSSRGEHHYLNVMKKLVSILNVSLRDIEQVFTRLYIVFKTIEPRMFESHFRLFVLFEMIKAYDSKVYEELVNRQTNVDKVKNLIIPTLKIQFHNEKLIALIEASLDSIGKSDVEHTALIVKTEEELEKCIEVNGAGSEEYKSLNKYIQMLKFSPSGWDDYYLNNMTKTVINKLEFADEFNLTVIQEP